MVFTVHRVLFLSSVLLFTACNKQIELQSFNANSVHLENRNGIVYNEENPFSGNVFELNEKNDTIALFGFYKGKEHGQWKRSYGNGQLEELRYFDKGVKTKTLTRWWANGQKQLQCSFESGEYEGELQEWNENGQLTKEMNYKNGYENGSQKMYYDNGKIRSNYVVKNGKRTGLLGTKNCVNVSDSVFKK
jgi:antitoxin component YwqK of YwqJK toxin-antitoxin module